MRCMRGTSPVEIEQAKDHELGEGGAVNAGRRGEQDVRVGEARAAETLADAGAGGLDPSETGGVSGQRLLGQPVEVEEHVGGAKMAQPPLRLRFRERAPAALVVGDVAWLGQKRRLEDHADPLRLGRDDTLDQLRLQRRCDQHIERRRPGLGEILLPSGTFFRPLHLSTPGPTIEESHNALVARPIGVSTSWPRRPERQWPRPAGRSA